MGDRLRLHRPCLRTQLAFALDYRSSWRDFEACSQLHELAPWNFVQLQPVCDVDPTSDLLSSSDSSLSSHDYSRRSAALCANPLNNHNFVIFLLHCVCNNIVGKIILLSKRWCLVCENWTWNNGVVVVWRRALHSLRPRRRFRPTAVAIFSCGCYGAGQHNWPQFWSFAIFFHFILPSHIWHQWKALLVLYRMVALFWLHQVQNSNKPRQKPDWLTV